MKENQWENWQREKTIQKRKEILKISINIEINNKSGILFLKT